MSHPPLAPPLAPRQPDAAVDDHYHPKAHGSRGAEMRPFELILEHRELVDALDALDAQVALLRSDAAGGQGANEPWRKRLADSLRAFTRSMSSHFEAESPATAAIFAEHADASLVESWRELDGEHSWLLHRFLAVTSLVESQAVSRDEIVVDLEEAMSTFRRHEARENALFGAG